MAWVVDQEEIAAPLEEQTFGDSQISLVTTVPIAVDAWIFVNLSSYGNDSIASVSDDGPGLTWVVVQGISSENANQRVAIARAFAPAGMSSGTTITAAWTGNEHRPQVDRWHQLHGWRRRLIRFRCRHLEREQHRVLHESSDHDRR